MEKFRVTNDYKSIVKNNIPLLDVRAPIEYEKGAFINSYNIPLLSNEEREIIGICYKNRGSEEAVRLGYKLISGENKENKLKKWKNYLDKNPNALIYCFRGGSRSTLSQECIINELGINIVKLEGGYKAFRNYLINSLNPSNINSTPIVLSGYTGSGKTILLKELNNSIDLEGHANHRGSAFGNFITSQPSQINFENNLAYDVIKHNDFAYKYMIFEDEGKCIGKSFIPRDFYNFIHNGNIIFLEASLDERVNNVLYDYIIDAQKQYIKFYDNNENGIKKWFENIEESIFRVKKRMGGDKVKLIIDEFERAYKLQCSNNSYDNYKECIRLFLEDYYDPMYKHSMERINRKVIFSGDKKAITEYIKYIESNY